MPQREFRLGRARARSPEKMPATGEGASGNVAALAYDLPAHHLVTHAVCVGMTGSGKTGLCIGLVEEALRSRVPVLLIDVKGDLANLALTFDALDGPSFLPWVDVDAARRDGKTPEAVAESLATRWREGLLEWGLGPPDVRALREQSALRIITPGTTAGEPLHVLSPLEQKSDLWDQDEEAAREALSAAISLLLRMVQREADPARGREHVLLSHLSERRLRAGESAGLPELLGDLQEPPIDRVGALSVDEFLPPKERAELAKDLNALIASPTFATWQKGAPLDVGAWMAGAAGDPRTPATILSVAHLEDEERMLVLSLVLEQALAWVRGLSGTTDLRALILFDEVFGFIPPHPSNPPTKRPLLALLKQARAFGVGCVLATQNPIDIDYKALSNAGLWFIGRLQTDADRERVVEGLAGADASAGGERMDAATLADVIKALPPRTFFVRDVHAGGAAELLETRWTLSWLRGPMTRQEIKRWSRTHGSRAVEGAATSVPPPPAPVEPRGEGMAAAARARAGSAPVPEPTVAAGEVPDLPDGWRPLFPCPPAAPLAAWRYVPHAAIVARVEIADARLGYRESRTLALLAPAGPDGVDFAQACPFDPADLRHAAVSGAAYAPLGDAFKGARATKSTERTLRERVLASPGARATVFVNTELELLSTAGEAREAFDARCAAIAKMRAAHERAVLLAKHDPKIQTLATKRDAHQQAQVKADVAADEFLAGAKMRDKAERQRARLVEAEAALREAVARRNAAIVARDADLARAVTATVTRELVAKKEALSVDYLAIAWLPT